MTKEEYKTILTIDSMKKFMDGEAKLKFCKQEYADRVNWYLKTYFKDQEYEHLLEAYHDLKGYYLSDIENLQDIVSELIEDLATVCSGEGLGNKADIIRHWSEKAKYYPSLAGLSKD
jgi:hypothetical protein